MRARFTRRRCFAGFTSTRQACLPHASLMLSSAPAWPTQVGESWNALAHIRQAVTFLVIHQKHRKVRGNLGG